MDRKENKIILVLVLIFLFSTHVVDAQFWKKKKHLAVPADSTVIVQDSAAAAEKEKTKEKKAEAAVAIPKPKPEQDTAFIPKDYMISFGYGFIVLDADVIRWAYKVENATANLFGPIYLKVERAVDYHWTLGINLAYGHYNITTPTTYHNFTTSKNFVEYRADDTFSALARVTYHFDMIGRYDPYVGFGLGWRTSSSDYRTSNPNGVAPESYDNVFPVGFETTGGVRYRLSKNSFVYGEVGLAKSALQVGYTYKLK